MLRDFIKKIHNATPAKRKHIKDLRSILHSNNNLLASSICNPNGIWKLELMLHNASVPKQHYNIFYKMLSLQKSNHYDFYEDTIMPPPPDSSKTRQSDFGVY